MTLRQNTLLALLGTLVVLLAVLYWFASAVVMRGFLAAERDSVVLNLERARSAIATETDGLAMKLTDWAAWDDTYRFVADGNEAYRKANLNAQTFVDLGLAFMLIADPDRRPVYAATLGPDGEGLTLGAGWVAGLAESAPGLFESVGLKDGRSGLLHLPEGLFAVAAAPIITSEHTGPGRGTMVFGRRLDQARIAVLSERLRMGLVIHGPEDAGAARADRAELARLGRPDSIGVVPLSGDTIAGFTAMTDILGRPALVLRAEMPRSVFRQGRASIRYFLGFMVVAGSVFAAAMAVAMGKLVLGRVARLSAELQSMTGDQDLSRRVSVLGRDELAGLASDVNAVLGSFEAVRAELEDRTLELAVASDQAERASLAKSEFLANMSHEIRTPMNAILGYADLIDDESIPPALRREHIRTIQRNGDHLLTLVNDILDLSKIEAGRMGLELRPCSPVQIAADVCGLMRQRAAVKNVELATEFAWPLPATITCDPVRLRQILVNLVGNAVKFTERGRITVALSLKDGAEPQLRFTVADTGIGMDNGQIGSIFRPFTQGDSSTTRRFGGTGLGLTISQRLAHMLGGEITVRSVPGEGSTFCATVAAGDLSGVEMLSGPPAERGPESARPPERAMLRARVLLAEDGEDNQRLFGFYLRSAGAEVRLVENGAEAVGAAAADGGFDLVLLDMQMPVMDGYTAAAELRGRGFTGPILALTAHAMAGDRERCLTAGCDDYYTKPIGREALVAACALWVERRPRAKAA